MNKKKLNHDDASKMVALTDFSIPTEWFSIIFLFLQFSTDVDTGAESEMRNINREEFRTLFSYNSQAVVSIFLSWCVANLCARSVWGKLITSRRRFSGVEITYSRWNVASDSFRVNFSFAIATPVDRSRGKSVGKLQWGNWTDCNELFDFNVFCCVIWHFKSAAWQMWAEELSTDEILPRTLIRGWRQYICQVHT